MDNASGNSPAWPSAVVAVAFIALVGVMFWKAAEEDFATIWAGVGTIVGVLTGAIPSYFFRAQAQQATDTAQQATATAQLAAARAEALSAVANEEQVEAAAKLAPSAFEDLGVAPNAT